MEDNMNKNHKKSVSQHKNNSNNNNSMYGFSHSIINSAINNQI